MWQHAEAVELSYSWAILSFLFGSLAGRESSILDMCERQDLSRSLPLSIGRRQGRPLVPQGLACLCNLFVGELAALFDKEKAKWVVG